jgi:hypothetical protein
LLSSIITFPKTAILTINNILITLLSF